MKISIEHKMDNIAIKAGHWSKAHYAFFRFDTKTAVWDDRLYSIRGARDVPGLARSPLFDMLDNCVLNGDFSNISLNYQVKRLLKISEWNIIQNSKTRSEDVKSIRPGEPIIEERYYRLNNLDKPIMKAKEFKKRVNRGSRKDYPVLFERFYPRDIQATVDALPYIVSKIYF